MIPVILSGGSGSRLWPLSRSAYPKQFLPLCSGYSLVQDTVLRLKGSVADEPPVFVTANDQRFLLADQVQALNLRGVILRQPLLWPVLRRWNGMRNLCCWCFLRITILKITRPS